MNLYFKFYFPILLMLFTGKLEAQSSYTDIQFEYRVDSSLYYGTATNYAGNPVDLYMDIYKPIGDNNLHRPLIVMAFGGAWIGGDKRSYDITTIAPWFAKRGYVVAAIDYRLGFHPSIGVGSNYVTCPAITEESNCVYPADSNEVIRAIFRGMQDMKGAVRWLKARNVDDSTCVNNVFLAGVSAGGFNALAAAFLDSDTEKPLATFAMTDAAGPPNTLNYCHDYHNENGATISRIRPDLGSIEGDIAINGYNSEVVGVANFIGGMLRDYFMVENGESPMVYMHHQTSDLIVDCNRSPLLSSISYNCLDPLGFLGCNHVWNTPSASGSCNIQSWLLSNNYDITHLETISQTGGPNCIQDPPGHSVVNPQLRVSEIATFFDAKIASNELIGCDFITAITSPRIPQSKLYPNPANQLLNVESTINTSSVSILDATGRILISETAKQNHLIQISTANLSSGIYFCRIAFPDGNVEIQKIILNH
jgi:acetyl esterase/lipase